MQPNRNKIIRVTVFSIAVTIVSSLALEQPGYQELIIFAGFMIGMLLAYGVDIREINYGDLSISLGTRQNDKDEPEED